MGRLFTVFLFLLVMAAVAPSIARAGADPLVVQKTREVAAACPGAWETPACLRVLSQSNYLMLANYGAALQQQKHEVAAEQLKQHCAASTAHREQAFPAYAMRSAFVECANTISDIVDTTGLMPNQDLYRLLLLPVYCLDGHITCPVIEKTLRQFK
ncbi:MAG: hypothetical protein HYS17_03785 [Micavibrio aeruginosavorus]|uniref:Pectinesterase inhibitor domain-containing protein n=1 Tax=Micavibrio aeruginosavorus TaxID=349221 RepID=A0A7T5UIP4_9BACT|nr:MAG: hypothetical protein HYS17_03785 [Micavibrio aeruginosavorus]